ncbi:exodeoxyribonuclease I [Neptunicella marina]|uniref:Exodeoxyribonuclease I n=1 Tax=Neptunicella marina TaxID=2125989 RepID=A0A8J6IY30_9ALTE|nr:exodeoxyribonuclease I [Neptunicella marina]MBC3767328.1 exodeoxyribonuclease I [Neptunicella marina]
MNTPTNQPTILWHDYETWGADPQKDHPSQFAAIRTDLDLNEVGKPSMFYCQPVNDCLPQPVACLITGITPQHAMQNGYCEAEFMRKVHELMSQPQTCVAGYNSLRFDDEVTRYGLYRNFYDPYAREWQNGNSRWDIIDMVRACYALRPEGINWPMREDGSPSFKLEALTQANDIQHADAHDALSDVRATIAMAKLIKQKQPKLYDYLFNLRKKKNVGELINIQEALPLVHISSKLPAENGCTSWIVPVAYHPTNKNAVIVLNLALDPTPLIELSSEQLLEKLFTRNADLAPDEQRLPVKLVHLNKCPVLAPAKTLTEENAQRLGIDRKQCLEHLQLIKRHPDIAQKLTDMYQLMTHEPIENVDYALYSGGFFSEKDKAAMDQIRSMSPEQLSGQQWSFDDARLSTMLFRYRARNFPHTLTEQEAIKWQQHRQQQLLETGPLTLESFVNELNMLAEEYQNDTKKLAIIRALYQYGQGL